MAARKKAPGRKKAAARKAPAKKKVAARKAPARRTAPRRKAAPAQQARKARAASAPRRPRARAVAPAGGVETPAPVATAETTGTTPLAEPDDREPKDEVLEVFRHYDRDASGSIDAAELARLLEALGMAPTEEELSVALDVVDRDRSGKISWSEFRAWWKGR